jgi:hypothetical protein
MMPTDKDDDYTLYIDDLLGPYTSADTIQITTGGDLYNWNTPSTIQAYTTAGDSVEVDGDVLKTLRDFAGFLDSMSDDDPIKEAFNQYRIQKKLEGDDK